MQTKAFDLNIGKILENWEIKHAIREVIANALDEQILTNSDDIVIQKDNEHWIIRDFGRGLQHTHLTQNENAEKLSHPFVIGKFGIGLKDALATFERHNVAVEIKSKFGIIKTTKMTKHGFGDLVTLHAIISESDDTDFKGTEFKIYNISDKDMEAAKQLFLKFSNKQLLDSNKYGQILLNDGDISNIYINGVLVAYEDNFLFSYNVTQLNAQLKKSINRERTNVGRSAYAEIVKKILLSSNSEVVATMLADDLSNFSDGDIHDELSWIDIQEHAVKILNTTGNVLLSTSSDLQSDPDMMDDIKTNGVKIVVIPEHLKSRIDGEKDKEGNAINTFDQYVKSYNDNFEFDYVNIKDFTEQERKLFYLTNDIVEIIGLPLYNTKSLHISNIMQKEIGQAYQIKGVWIGSEKKIVIHRDVMRSPQEYFGILAHEIIHAETGEPDVSRGFENELTKLVGKLCQKVLILEKSKKESIMSDSVKTNDREYELKKLIVNREKELIEKFEKEKQLLIQQHKETEKKLRDKIERLYQPAKIKDKKWYQFW